MNKDIRINVDFFQHHKTKRLKRKLGLEGLFALQQLWCYAAKNRPKGSLTDMDAVDIASVADWEGDEQEFVSCLCEIGFLEQCEEGFYHIHDWENHNPYAAYADERSEAARKAARARWEKKNSPKGMPPASTPHADGMRPAYDEHTKGNAPSPSPSPSPSPKNTEAEATAPAKPNDYFVIIETQDPDKPLNITHEQKDKWQDVYKFIDVGGELHQLRIWAEQNPKKRWKHRESAFFAVPRCLGKKNQEALMKCHHNDPHFDPSDPTGEKQAQAAQKKTLELVGKIGQV